MFEKCHQRHISVISKVPSRKGFQSLYVQVAANPSPKKIVNNRNKLYQFSKLKLSLECIPLFSFS